MKILRIIARLNVGGPARHVIWLTEGLQSAGYETLLAAGVVPPGEDDMSYLATAAGVTPFIIPEMSREISLKDALTTWKLFRLMVRERPELVHTHTAKAGTVGRVAGLMYRWLTPATLIGKPRPCRFVHTYHGHVFHSYYGRLKTRLFLTIERSLARLITDRIVVISHQQRHEINEVFRVGRSEQFAVIPLGLDLSGYANPQQHRPRLRAELHASEATMLIGIVGRLTEIKNHRLFLQAAALLKSAIGSGARFVIVGDGRLRGELEAQAKMLRLDDDVLFLGTRNDPEDFYPALDIVALTSLNEGTPLTLIEAMANARPIIATAVGGVVDLLGPAVSAKDGYTICERGLVVESGDAEAFARGLRRLLEEQALGRELGRRGLEFVIRNYGKDRLLRNMAELYAELMRGNSPTVREGSGASPNDYHARLTPHH
ncbi:MAG TPA: glycosyltransferase [Pyrinomonadaceae bacterium]|nr:glycosyltransferase [Pyrinomonadaceae bacterium]